MRAERKKKGEKDERERKREGGREGDTKIQRTYYVREIRV